MHIPHHALGSRHGGDEDASDFQCGLIHSYLNTCAKDNAHVVWRGRGLARKGVCRVETGGGEAVGVAESFDGGQCRRRAKVATRLGTSVGGWDNAVVGKFKLVAGAGVLREKLNKNLGTRTGVACG